MSARKIGRLARHPLGIALLLVLLVGGPAAAGFVLAGQRFAPPTPTHPAGAIHDAVDTDRDGLSDLDELAIWGTDPERPDTDGDAMPDGWEAVRAGAPGRCPEPRAHDAARDCVGKGIPLALDHLLGTDPRLHDSDEDGIRDEIEASLRMDPLRADAENDPFGDGLTNARRAMVGARADRIDTACSGVTDARKLSLELDPRVPSTHGNGVPDGYALAFGLDPLDPELGGRRLDGDPAGLTVREKAAASFARHRLCATPERSEPDWTRALDPRTPDSDTDGMPDAWEVAYALDPTDPTDAERDLDGDGVSNRDAFAAGACPEKLDCDGDGLDNARELAGWNVTVDGRTRHVTSDPRHPVTDGGRMGDAAKRAGEWTLVGRTYRFPPLDPATADTDSDGIRDDVEVSEYDGLLDPTRKDTDADGIDDGDEVREWTLRAVREPDRSDALCPRCAVLGRDAAPNVANPDADGDGILDGEEVRPGPRAAAPSSPVRVPFPPSDPSRVDGDGDGLPDAWERRNARFVDGRGEWDLDPSREESLGAPDALVDLDADGLDNAGELASGTDPHEPDTDSDGMPDGFEHAHGRGSLARYAPAPTGAGFRWHGRTGDLVPLTPTDPADARIVLASYAWPGTTVSWTMLDAFRLNVSPERADADDDGVPDLLERHWGLAEGDASLTDNDGDGLSDAEEFRRGTSPLLRDTDGGGLDDRAEVLARLDPWDRRDDAGDGDLDGDGLTNSQELQGGTGIDAFDTDRDGLLDGGDVELVLGGDSPLRDTFLAAGVVHARVGESLRFRGEPTAECARKRSCSDDGLPDGWKVYHGLDPLRYYPASTSLTADGLGILLEYAWGRPADWDEARDGPWWLGLDPTRPDTRGDGIRDDARTTLAGPGDLDGDGLHDLTGEDPTPFIGEIDPRDARAVLAHLAARQNATLPPRVESAVVVDEAPRALVKGNGSHVGGRLRVPAGVPVERIPILVSLVPVTAEGSPEGLRSTGAIVGVGFASPAGEFLIPVVLGREHSTAVPAGVATLLGRPAVENMSWTLDSAAFPAGRDVRIVVWTYAVPHDGRIVSGGSWASGAVPVDAGQLAARVTSGALRAGVEAEVNVTYLDGANDPHPVESATLIVAGDRRVPARTNGANATFVLVVPSGTRAGPLPGVLEVGAITVPVTLDVRAATRLALDVPPRATADQTLRLDARLVDELGAPISGAPIAFALGSARMAASTDTRGGASVLLDVGSVAPGARPAEATFAGDAHHDPAHARSAAIALVGTPRLVDAVATARLGAGGELRARILVGDRPLPEAVFGETPEVIVTLGDALARITPDASGRIRVAWPASALERGASARIGLPATSTTAALDETVKVNVASETRLVLEDGTAARGRDAVLHGRLVDLRGVGVADATVTGRFGDARAEVRTRPDGTFAILLPVPKNATLGAAIADVAYAGDGGLGPSAGTANLSLRSTLRAHVDPVIRAEDPWVRGRVLHDDGTPASALQVAVEIEGRTLDALPLDSDGGFAIRARPTELSLPMLAVGLIVPATPTTERLRGDFAVFTGRSSVLQLDVQPGEVAAGGSFVARVRLADGAGAPLAGHEVRFWSGDVERDARTDADGRATWTLAAGVPGRRVVEARFPGAPGILASDTAQDVVVKGAPVLRAGRSAEGVRPLVELTLLRHDGAVLANATVLVRSASGTLLRAVTDVEGRAAIELAEPAVVSFLGDDGHSGVTVSVAAAQAAPRLDEARGPALGVVAILALAIVLAAIFAWRARRSRDEIVLAFGVAERAFRPDNVHAAAVAHAYAGLLRALVSRGIVDPARATPREALRLAAEALAVPASDLEPLVRAFEETRYSGRDPTSEAALAARAALATLHAKLEESR